MTDTMTAQELYDYQSTLSAADSWAWVYAQSPATQAACLRNKVALGAAGLGMDPEAAWKLACERVPEGATFGLGGPDPKAAWAEAIAMVSAPVPRPMAEQHAFQEAAFGVWSDLDVAATMCSAAGGRYRNLVTSLSHVSAPAIAAPAPSPAPRRKPGRPAKGDRPMTAAERVAASRARHGRREIEVTGDLAARIRGLREASGETTADLLSRALSRLEAAPI